MKHLLGLGVMIFLFACQQNKTTSAAEAEVLPNTPETVVRQYQALMDSNLFDRAALLSTGEGKAMLDVLAEIMAGDPPDSSIIHTDFLKLDCVVQVDTAHCTCLLKDEYEAYESLFKLIKINGQWLVDAPEEEDMEMSEEEWMEDAKDEDTQ